MTILDDLQSLIEEKNRYYGDSVGKTANLLFTLCPDGIKPSRYHDLHIVVRMLDKISRIMGGNPPPEALVDAYRDIAGYAILALKQLEEE